MVSADESSLGKVVPLTEEKVLELLESAYPNPITVVDMARENGWAEDEVALHLAQLQEKGLVVKQMPTMTSSKQPTIAIITAQYCEKLAVDAMIENKETFVRYTTVGESNVYTLGNIGAHRIVCTKLPTVGHTREAMTAAGNTTTRLLGTFQKVDHVFLVGVGGGVPHFTDYNKHVRLGDVVVSHPIEGHKYVSSPHDLQQTTSGNTFKTNPFEAIKRLNRKLAAGLRLKWSTNRVTFYVNTLADHSTLLEMLVLQGYQPYTFPTDGERDGRLVIRGLPVTSPCEDVQAALMDKGYQVRRVTRLGARPAGPDQVERPFPLFLVTLRAGPQPPRTHAGSARPPAHPDQTLDFWSFFKGLSEIWDLLRPLNICSRLPYLKERLAAFVATPDWSKRLLTHKVPELLLLMSDHAVDIAFLTETWFTEASVFQVPGFLCHRADRGYFWRFLEDKLCSGGGFQYGETCFQEIVEFVESRVNTKSTGAGTYEFETKAYSPANLGLQEIAVKLKVQSESEDCSIPWLKYLKEGLSSLGPESEQDFNQPPPESDKLYMSIGERDLIEVAHPAPLEGATKRQEGCPRLYLAPIASGRAVAREDQLRQQFSSQFGTLAFDSEFDAVVDSVIGNCRDSFVILRGIADYKDGTRRKEWQPYASLVAASIMKAIICGMDAPTDA
uniref:Winged helix-turn-helix domain-containing protein n=2 Tax=Timema TaxID=61471 RepID=A0A7R9AQG3_TIMSH|nr:unnamed protein product [Timema shepardi]